MSRLLAIALLASSVLTAPALADTAPTCKASPKVVDKCMTFYGRLSVYTGSPAIRLWPVGTKQLYGVRGTGDDPENLVLPEKLRDMLATNPIEINGKWEVCPLEPARPNQLRSVCLEGATELKPVPRTPVAP
ncbi:hypothetical protein [Emcibacter sp. SYSU 3D8]|uniref:hypothetical protein n=1 Tax=Emcibacter sp. SYSU 3D8 TaxID=3133969 RepID=UPI0031FF1344